MKISLILLFVIFTVGAKCQKTDIVFQEGFEASSIESVLVNWNAAATKNADGMRLVGDVPKSSVGKQSLMMTYTPGVDEGGHLFKTFPEGYDSLFVRFYVKFLTGRKLHHFVKLGGYNPLTDYPQGGAGTRPNGKNNFISGIEKIVDSWNWGFYSYWMDMKSGPNPDKYWGNTFLSNPVEEIKKEEWICVEFMIKMNSPLSALNGEQAFWINGEKILHLGKGFPNGNWTWGGFVEDSKGAPFEGFQWRSDEKLKLNYLWLDYYMTKGEEVEQVLIDDVAVSRSYIGPLK